MAANTSPVFEKDPISYGITYVNADSSPTKKDLVPTGGVPTEGSRVDQITITSDDTSARVIKFYDHDGSVSYLIGSVNVPTLAGTDGSTALVDAMTTLAPALGYITLMSGHKLQAENATTITAAKTVTIVARGGKFTA